MVERTNAAGISAGPYEDGDAAYFRKDYATALRLYRPLADQGHAEAQNSLGLMYLNGQGVPQDYAAAVSWYRKAAEQGIAEAQYYIGAMYVNGKGVPQNYVQGHMWFNVAAARFPASETEKRNSAVSARANVAKKMTPAQVAEAQKLASEWKPK